ncbi:MAG: DUF169 domain-containing protein [Candidatus Methanomethylophilaceae archaeon]|nr:DUF169 domain-containing protein [Candidatus Methanomethylophilaceae archaeon]MDY5872410.1 DUF169 domain-containing protein [Candidatus Methanomethylophilaceae archaeon]
MSEILARNGELAEKLKNVVKLRSEPVAVKLVRKGEAYPDGYSVPEKQLSHCQAVMSARHGNSVMMPLSAQGCMVGASTLGMTAKPEKVKTGEFHYGIGIHETVESTAEMIATVTDIDYEVDGEVICPLKDADFEPDVVIFVDIPERVYWFEALFLRKNGGHISYVTAPFQCACADITAYPIMKDQPNISLGCFGCRKKTDMQPDELALGFPYGRLVSMASALDDYETGVMTKAKRD